MEATAEMHAESMPVGNAKPRGRAADAAAYARSRLSNGSDLLPDLDQRSASARRYRDLVASFTSDTGLGDALSEAQKQLIRRAASLSLACERLEAEIVGGAPPQFKQEAGGLSPFDILQESARILHAVARVKGGGTSATVQQFAALPDAEMARVSDLLVKAGDLAHRAISAGSERAADLELLAMLSARLVRVLQQLGLRRQAREVAPLTLAALLAEDEQRQSGEAAGCRQNDAGESEDADAVAPHADAADEPAGLSESPGRIPDADDGDGPDGEGGEA